MKMTAWLAAVLASILMISAFPLSSWGEDSDDQNGQEEPILVGRLSHVEESALRYDPDENQWVGVAEDAPFGFNDRLKTEQDGRAKIRRPWSNPGAGTNKIRRTTAQYIANRATREPCAEPDQEEQWPQLDSFRT